MTHRFPWDGIAVVLGATLIVLLISMRSDRLDRAEQDIDTLAEYAATANSLDSAQCIAIRLLGERMETVEYAVGIGGEE